MICENCECDLSLTNDTICPICGCISLDYDDQPGICEYIPSWADRHKNCPWKVKGGETVSCSANTDKDGIYDICCEYNCPMERIINH